MMTTDISEHASDASPGAPDRFVTIEGIDGGREKRSRRHAGRPPSASVASGSFPRASGAGRLSRRNFVPSSSTKATRSRIGEESPLGSVPLAGSDDAAAGVRPAVETVTAVAGTVMASAEGRAPAPRDLATGRMDQHRPIMEPASKIRSGSHSQLWMRAVSFAGLHRILKAVGDTPGGLRAKEINDLVLEQKVVLTPANPHPKPTTLYHYRTTLLRLNAVIRKDWKLIANTANPDVGALLREPAPAISDLIIDYCQAYRQPRSSLFGAIDWLRREWPFHTVLIPTSRAMATFAATSPQREALALRRYYKSPQGPYISHIRVHEAVTCDTTDATRRHVQHASEARA